MGPDWLGSPQHVRGGAFVTVLALLVLRRTALPMWVRASLAIGASCLAETLIELLEYPVLYDDERSVQAYWDTLADLAATLAGALLVTGIWFARATVRRRFG